MAGKVFIHATMSFDGYIGDPEGAIDFAAGHSGLSKETVGEIIGSIGAVLAGRRGYDRGMMRGDQKAYGGAWSGPQFVLTHRPDDAPPQDPSITFLSSGVRDAVATGLAAAGGKDLVVMGADVGRQCLREGLVDEILIHLVPVLLGEGIRLFESTGHVELEPVDVAWTGDLTTMRMRVVRP
ncbi:dihydrofolate reductase family protein [Actinomadura sp. DC4]|uniref:dihydrofolate reductase family protein n=1 Tax=Actinomadura sp. DC4 TaxID=3055069 RepID=UPI0025B0B428|nr:dihydrofolate reductase family protein [Actinomadura sp. DC4]MDN3354306.1 dihydrofolate reductase family protein [Actinomadura sp. DC4]